MGFSKEKLYSVSAPFLDSLWSTLPFTESDSYQTDVARLLCSVSAWSYADLDTFRHKLAHVPSFTGGDFWEVSVRNEAMFIFSHAQIIRSSDGRRIVISFRGTEIANICNWLTDASTRKCKYTDGGTDDTEVHSGFLRNFQEVWNGQHGVFAHLVNPVMLEEEFDDYERVDQWSTSRLEQDKLEEIYITGHSLGGAMAMLAGMALYGTRNTAHGATTTSSLWDKLKGIYTYGQPMVVGNNDRKACHDRIGNKLFRHVCYNDIVPHLPPLSVGAFDHCGDEYKYTPDVGHFQLRRQAQNVQWTRPFLKMPWSVSDHFPASYMEAFLASSHDNTTTLVIEPTSEDEKRKTRRISQSSSRGGEQEETSEEYASAVEMSPSDRDCAIQEIQQRNNRSLEQLDSSIQFPGVFTSSPDAKELLVDQIPAAAETGHDDDTARAEGGTASLLVEENESHMQSDYGPVVDHLPKPQPMSRNDSMAVQALTEDGEEEYDDDGSAW